MYGWTGYAKPPPVPKGTGGGGAVLGGVGKSAPYSSGGALGEGAG